MNTQDTDTPTTPRLVNLTTAQGLADIELRQDLLFCDGLDEDYFLSAMKAIWASFGNHPVDGMDHEWVRIFRLATDVLHRNQQIIPEPVTRVYPGQMGLGKSLAAQTIAAMCGGRGQGATLIIERKDMVDDAVDTVNLLARKMAGPGVGDVAIGKHTGERWKNVTPQQMRDYPILISTHAGYQSALSRSLAGNSRKLQTLQTWNGGRRHLTIIDEAFDAVESYELTAAAIRKLFGYLAAVGKGEDPAVDALRDVWTVLEQAEKEVETAVYAESTTAAFQSLTEHWREYMEATDKLRHDCFDPSTLRKIRRIFPGQNWERDVDKTLGGIQRMLVHQSFLSKTNNNGAQFNAANYLLPEDVGSCLILDGTATHNPSYDLVHTSIVEKPVTLRSYRYTQVHLTNRQGCGADRYTKGKAAAKRYVAELYDNLAKKLPSVRKVLVVTHLEGRPYWMEHQAQVHHFDTFDVATWGAATGSNKWRDFDTVVIATQFFKPQAMMANKHAATRGIDEAVKRLNNAGTDDSKVGIRALITGELLVDTLQAIFRIRLRKPVHSDGRPDPCDVFVVLPEDRPRGDGIRDVRTRGAAMRDAIVDELPDAAVHEWDLPKPRMGQPCLDPEQERQEEQVFNWMKSQKKPFTSNDIKDYFPFVKEGWKKGWGQRLSGPNTTYRLRRKVEEEFDVVTTGRGRATVTTYSEKELLF